MGNKHAKSDDAPTPPGRQIGLPVWKPETESDEYWENLSKSSTIRCSEDVDKQFLIDKIKGCIWGAALGDAIGLSTENMTKEIAKLYYGTGPITFAKFADDGHRQKWSLGDWTDDTDQLCCILNSLIDNYGEVQEQDFAKKLLEWSKHGFPELGDLIGRGMGVTVGSVLNHPKFLENPHQAAKDVWVSRDRKLASNGAVMRTAILGIPNFSDLDKVVENTIKICKVTHTDPRCIVSCIAVTVAIAKMLQKKDENLLEEVIEISLKNFDTSEIEGNDLVNEFKSIINTTSYSDLKLDEQGKIGFTYKALGSGFCALRANDFRSEIEKLVLEAGDADTNGIVAGALLGCKLGYEKLPKEWLNDLLEKEWLEYRVNKLLVLMGLK